YGEARVVALELARDARGAGERQLEVRRELARVDRHVVGVAGDLDPDVRHAAREPLHLAEKAPAGRQELGASRSEAEPTAEREPYVVVGRRHGRLVAVPPSGDERVEVAAERAQ